MKNITARLPEHDINRLKTEYATLYKGVQKSVSALLALQAKSLDEIKGIFSREEVIGMTSSLFGTLLEDRYMAINEIILHDFEDSEKYEGAFSANSADIKNFKHKFTQLTSAQTYFLIEEIRRFWEDSGAYGSPSPDLEKLIEKLT